MTYTVKYINRFTTNRLTGKTCDMSGWHIMKGEDWERGPLRKDLAETLAAVYNSRKA